jgi:hypothetical protein
MTQFDKLLSRILTGKSDANIGFEERIKGDHHIFFRSDIPEIISIQPESGKAKSYQVKQVRTLITKYKLGVDNDES